MVTKSSTFANRIVGNPLWKGVTDALLTSTLHWNWVSYDVGGHACRLLRVEISH